MYLPPFFRAGGSTSIRKCPRLGIVNCHKILLSLAMTLAASPAGALEVRMAADTMTVHAEQVPLREILSHFQNAGVRIAIDERINPLITADFDNREIGDAVKRLLADCDYALSWKSFEGPAGRMSRLSEILVYKPGDRRELKPLPLPTAATAQARTSQTNTIVCLKDELLVRMRPGTTQEQFRNLLLKTGALVLDGIPALGIYRLRFPPGSDLAAILNELTKDPLVSKAEPNQVYRSITPHRGSGNGGTPAPPLTITAGKGPAVAVLDSGLKVDASLEKAIVASLDATSPGQAISDPVGHGTQMAYIAAGAVSPTGTDPASLAAAPIISIRTMDNQGITSSFSLMQSMVFSLEHGARVISMSWGSENNSQFFNDAILYAQKQGAVMVAAAGNEPTGRPLYPAALPNVVAVAALTPDGNIWDQSNYGSFITLAAPGFANLPVGYKGPPGPYGGTSIAAAYTSRAIAQYFAAHPQATATEAIQALHKVLSPAPQGTLHPEIPRLTPVTLKNYLNPP